MTATASNRILGDLPGNYVLHFHCSNAPAYYFNKHMDVEVLIPRLGQEFLVAGLYAVLNCPECKRRKFLVMLSPVHRSYDNLN